MSIMKMLIPEDVIGYWFKLVTKMSGLSHSHLLVIFYLQDISCIIFTNQNTINNIFTQPLRFPLIQLVH